ncbi:hypothetical protein GCM10022236_34060 [Microlunatus ginsengisoli]|uniref:Uncharacterized protein n=1 Tax=Microlunatus ginsengisoli TaxID=363863 RepID=A0ABP7AC49_9ACTN
MRVDRVKDPARPVGECPGHADREGGVEGRLMRYDGFSSRPELGTTEPLAGNFVKVETGWCRSYKMLVTNSRRANGGCCRFRALP